MLAQGRDGLGKTAYERHQPEQTLLYQLVETHYPALVGKKRGFCPSCGARRMAETAALLADEVFPDVPLRQWVFSFPFPLRYLFAAHPQAMGKVLGVIYRAISTHLIHKAGYRLRDSATLSSTGKVVFTLKTPYRDGTTQVAFDGAAIRPVDFIARLAALARARSDQNPGSMERGRPVPLPRCPGLRGPAPTTDGAGGSLQLGVARN